MQQLGFWRAHYAACRKKPPRLAEDSHRLSRNTLSEICVPSINAVMQPLRCIARIALVVTATKPTAPQPPKFIYATKNEVKQQLALAKQRLDNNASDVRAAHAVAKILRALGDIDGDVAAQNVGFDNATAAWARAAHVDVEGAVHYALRRGDHAEAQRLIGERLRQVPDCQIALELRALGAPRIWR